MKTVVKYFVLSLFFFVLSCKKDDMPIYDAGTMEHGSMSACRNGDKWKASGEAVGLLQTDSLFIIGGSTYVYDQEDTFSIEGLNIRYLPFKKGRYALTGESIGDIQTPYAYMFIVDYDVIIERYYLDEDKESWVELTKVDTINNRIEGCFEIYLAVDEPKFSAMHADKLCFKKGEFAVDLLP
ncbi:MAG TPA: hypothetical protein PKH93_10335 [Chitinophagales bacterium]|nr:hypothetical protein [Chitinophagales bacterium]